jgi:hypothetical protein
MTGMTHCSSPIQLCSLTTPRFANAPALPIGCPMPRPDSFLVLVKSKPRVSDMPSCGNSRKISFFICRRHHTGLSPGQGLCLLARHRRICAR